MTDVFKKINDMLKEKKDDYDDMYRIFKKGGDKQLAYTTHEILKVIRYIRQMIGEMEKEYNDGWIPCSERLPEVEVDVLLTLRGLNIHTGFRANTEGYFYVDGGEYVEFEDVIAWQPLPAPYKPKGEK